MGDIIRRKLSLCMTITLCLLLLLSAILCFRGIYHELTTPDLNYVRTETSLLLSQIETTGQYERDTDYHYAVILSDGTVAYQNGLALNKKVNLHALGTKSADYYLVPFSENNAMSGILYIELYPNFCGKNTVNITIWSILFLLILTVILWIAATLHKTMQKDIFTPIKQLHDSTHDILYGKLDKPVPYDYDGEIGTLCHDFELMRKELADGLAREQILKDEEKLLLASISHDLKTPLSTVQGYLESICIGVVSEEEEVRRCCQNALNKTILLGNLINDILEHSKAELHKLSIEKEELYTADFFGTLSATLISDAKTHGYTMKIGEIPNALMNLDKTRITQVLENIVGNSYKYGHEGGTIELSFEQKDDFFFVTVQDDGPGIAPEDLPFVFQKFFRGDKSRTQSIPGSGLGLSIAKYIVEQHGGTIECDSIPGSGTQVRFSLKID